MVKMMSETERPGSIDAAVYLNNWAKRVGEELDRLVPESSEPPEIFEIMRYSLFAGGKRLRPVLCVAGCEAVGGNPEFILPAACALECIHSYSLIHDDLPAMDDDDLRRGMPTSHMVYGEAAAILAGDGLQALAFELMANEKMSEKISPGRHVKAIRMVADAAGATGMVGGQLLDIRADGRVSDVAHLEEIHRRKTGALLRVSVCLGGLLGGGDEAQLAALHLYGEKIGLAFQIVDDILDVEGDEALMGKPTGSDEGLNKATYPALYGMETSKQLARSTCEEALGALEIFPNKAPELESLAQFIILRRF